MHWNRFSGQAGCWGALKESQKGPKWPKMVLFLSHKRVWWLRTGRTVWNKGGTSQGTSGSMQWNCFSGQAALLGPQKDTKRAPNAQNGHFVAIRGSGGSELAEQCGIKVEQVGAHPGQCNGTFSLVRGAHGGPNRTPKGPKRPFWILWELSGTPGWPSLTRKIV